MTAGSVFFAFCSLMALLGAITVVASQNPIRSAVGLLATILGIAGFYLRLDAQFLAAIQIIVYAGAVVVLFVFVVMLLGADWKDIKPSTRPRWPSVAGGIGVSVLAIAFMWLASLTAGEPVALGHPNPGHGSLEVVGQALFTEAVVPFELATVLLIVAVVGALAVARSRSLPSDRGVAPVRRGGAFPQSLFGGPVHPRDAVQPPPSHTSSESKAPEEKMELSR